MVSSELMRKWHRWIGLVAALFFIVTAFTGIWLECERFFGEDEALREKLRDTVSKVSVQTPNADFAMQLARAQEAVAAKTGGQPLDKIIWQLKGDAPTVTFYLAGMKEQPARKLVVNAKTGALVKEENYDDDSFILKLHSGEALAINVADDPMRVSGSSGKRPIQRNVAREEVQAFGQ